ncbi:hypothetical protein U1Q18_040240 [Sarracenia purpurea var. burkii]
MVQEGALTALALVAESSQEHFQKYYDAVMPYLKAILVNATDKSNRMLRAKAMECISLIGMAVGKEKFRDDAKQVRGLSIHNYTFTLKKETSGFLWATPIWEKRRRGTKERDIWIFERLAQKLLSFG